MAGQGRPSRQSAPEQAERQAWRVLVMVLKAKVARRVVSKVEWHQGELFPRVGFIVTNLSYPNIEGIVTLLRDLGFEHQLGGDVRWTRLVGQN